MVQATRIEDESGRIETLQSALRRVISGPLRKEVAAEEKTADESLIPVTCELTSRQARTILGKVQAVCQLPYR